MRDRVGTAPWSMSLRLGGPYRVFVRRRRIWGRCWQRIFSRKAVLVVVDHRSGVGLEPMRVVPGSVRGRSGADLGRSGADLGSFHGSSGVDLGSSYGGSCWDRSGIDVPSTRGFFPRVCSAPTDLGPMLGRCHLLQALAASGRNWRTAVGPCRLDVTATVGERRCLSGPGLSSGSAAASPLPPATGCRAGPSPRSTAARG